MNELVFAQCLTHCGRHGKDESGCLIEVLRPAFVAVEYLDAYGAWFLFFAKLLFKTFLHFLDLTFARAFYQARRQIRRKVRRERVSKCDDG
jgi:hypothetical protein